MCPNPHSSSADEKECKHQEWCLLFLIVHSVDALQKSETLAKIRTARQRVRNEIQELTERLRITQENIKRIRQRSVDQICAPGTFMGLPNEAIE